MPVPFPTAGHCAHTPGGSAAALRPVTGVRLCFCGLQTLTHKARGSHIACGVTIADRIRFREFVVLTSVFVPKAASKPLRGPRAALGAASADKDTCNELCESLPGCQRGPVPHARFGFPPATPRRLRSASPPTEARGSVPRARTRGWRGSASLYCEKLPFLQLPFLPRREKQAGPQGPARPPREEP